MSAAIKLYYVTEGEAREIDEPVETDRINSILVAARSSEGALRVAAAYDRGLTDMDNMVWHGATIGVVRYGED